MIIEFLEVNASWLQDLSAIVFAFVATILAILTYRRAKETILQPVRTEVIKKQTDLLADLLEFLYKSKNLGGTAIDIDYGGLVQYNVFKLLKQHGFKLAEEGLLEELEKINKVAGFTVITSEIVQNDLEVIQTFNGKVSKTEDERSVIGRQYYEDGLKGRIVIKRICLTKAHGDYVATLEKYLEDPFMPLQVRLKLEKLGESIKINTQEHLKAVLAEFMLALYERHKKKENPSVSWMGVYNELNHRRIDHEPIIQELKAETRKYLKVDKMPL